MSNEPNYRTLSPPDDKEPVDYSWSERRSELYDMIERAGHYRNLERSQRELGRRYDVSHTTIRRDIEAILAWKNERMGDNAESELEMLKTAAVQKLIDENKTDKAYYLMKNHYETLMEAGVKERAADDVNLSHSGEVDGNFSVSINHHRVTDTDADDDDTQTGDGEGSAEGEQ